MRGAVIERGDKHWLAAAIEDKRGLFTLLMNSPGGDDSWKARRSLTSSSSIRIFIHLTQAEGTLTRRIVPAPAHDLFCPPRGASLMKSRASASIRRQTVSCTPIFT